ncbi:thermonuclease family protein, partial [Candidatus Peregrinibacteria bacterium]|nr:thermonuclease family protein [Candidatus Peregrinibacteria bacterium]
MKKRYGELIAVMAIMLFVYVISPFFNVSEGGANTFHDAALFSVVRVVDGDTFVYEDSGQDITVRMVGIDTPETVDPRKPVQCFGREASSKTKSLIEGKKVRLEKDALGDTIDKYQRELRNVYLEDGT